MKIMRVVSVVVVTLLFTIALAAQTVQPQTGANETADMLKQARQLSSEGKQAEAIAVYEQVLQKSPQSWQAHLGIGAANVLEGKYAEGRKHFEEGLATAPEDRKSSAHRYMAFSYAFEGDGKTAAKHEQQAFDMLMAKQDFEGAAGVANEAGRILLETGNIGEAEKWYRTGYETALKKAEITEADRNLWLFRWENAQARIAARRGKKDEAQKHVVAAKAALDKANNPDQAPYYPYLVGYVALYTGDAKTAIAELQKADQKDPFILSLIAQAYEKTGDTARANEYYGRVLEVSSFGPNGAFSRPLAQKKFKGAKK